MVVAMFAFAILATGLLYLYWDYHTRPFRPLQEALAREFEGSHPLVQGGQRKMRKQMPRILRIVLRTDFDPNQTDNEERVSRMVEKTMQLARRYHRVDDYQTVEIHLAWMRPEQKTKQRKIVIDVLH